MRRFASFDGVEIAYDVIGEGDPVVLHHGFASDSRTNWVRPGVAAAIVADGRQVVLVDARGHGESGKPHDPAAYANGAMADDVRSLLDLLGLEWVDFVGYSMGAFVAMRLAAVEPRLHSVVLGGAGLGQMRRWRPEQSREIAAALETSDPATIESPMARAFRKFADATGADRLALAAVQRAGRPVPGPEDLGRIAVPALVVNGVSDTLAGPPEALAGLIPGARSESVPGDHLSAVVQSEFRQAIVTFLDSL
ncbi:MAG TPA: alpha/beta hydrolase [Acidimicrobiales bacterium]|nr:alpha/beta hydrolase [Acidimicrobiales bacterium]